MVFNHFQKFAGPKKFISRFDDRQYAKNDIFVHFFNFKIFQIFLYCKFRQFKLFFIISKKPQVQKKFISRFDDRQYVKNDIFST